MHRSDIVLFCKALVFLLITTLASADSLQIIEYDYDKAGHLTGIKDHIQTQPPSILTIRPAYIHQQSSVQFTVSGNNLAGAKVSTRVAGLQG